MRGRKAVSPVVATIILVGVGLVLAVFVNNLYSETAFSNVRVEAIEYAYIYPTRHADVDNARWKIVLYVVNRGTVSLELTNVYINEQEVDVYGLIHGETLIDGHIIGTSLPVDGYWLEPGEGLEIYIWIGKSLFSPGTNLVVSLNSINSVTQSKTVQIY
jgi:flagellin-like protein